MALLAATGLMATLGCATDSQAKTGSGDGGAYAPAASSTTPSGGTAQPGRVTGARFVAPRATPTWHDEFSGTRLSAQWSHQQQGYQDASNRNCSKVDPRAVKVSKGTVRLSVIDDPQRPNGVRKCRVDGHSYDWRLNGHITTEKSHSFKYGTFAARMKFQPLRGQHASFWLWPKAPAAAEGSPALTGAEVDIIEWFGGSGLASFVYSYPNDGRDGVTPIKTGGYIPRLSRFGSRWATKFHVFSVKWTPREYVFSIDGKVSYRTTKGVTSQPEFINLSMLASDWELGGLKNYSDLPQTTSVDWVRYWKP
jgi:beta-glucanase (GH16 family)